MDDHRNEMSKSGDQLRPLQQSEPPGMGLTGTQQGPPGPPANAPRIALAVLVALVTAGLFVHVRWLHSKGTLLEAVGEANTWLALLTSRSVTANLLVFGPYLALLAVVAGLLVHFGLPSVWQSARRPLKVGVLVGACLAGAWFFSTERLVELFVDLTYADWLLVVPLVPPVLLAFQAMVSWRQRPRSVGDFRIGVSKELRDALKESDDEQRFKEVHAQLVRVFGGVEAIANGTAKPGVTGTRTHATRDGSYSIMSLATQFAVPTLLLLVVGFGLIALATNSGASELRAHPTAASALKWGAAGAYSYVLFTFGSRSFRNDLTVGAATWAIVTLITGPALAVVLALGWQMQTGGENWQSAIVFFFAGLAPRQVMSIIESTALRLLKSPQDVTAPRLIPLTTLRGISAELALRLREENIDDVTALAYADPIRLVQSVPYDLRQVVEWIDQAQLAVAVPQHYETLLQRGITGAIDLAWRWLQACLDPDTGSKDPKTGVFLIAHATAVPKSFKDLMGEDADAALVYETARQMFYEEQVRLLWVMYNCFSTTAGSAGSDAGTDPAERGPGTPEKPEKPEKKAA